MNIFVWSVGIFNIFVYLLVGLDNLFGVICKKVFIVLFKMIKLINVVIVVILFLFVRLIVIFKVKIIGRLLNIILLVFVSILVICWIILFFINGR